MNGLWLAQAAETEPAPPLAGDVRSDVCIAGGGYLGLWTALELKRRDPSLDVLLVEAGVCGDGASGRNGGFVLSWWSKFTSLEKACGTVEARRLARASAAAVDEIAAFCAARGVPCRRDGWLWAATSRAQLGAWNGTVARLEQLGEHPFRPVGADEAARLGRSPGHLGGVFESCAATVQPALLARALRTAALESGVRIHERSPVTRLERSRPPRVRTASGSVTAQRLVLCLNAWAARLHELRRGLIVVASDVVATEPAPELDWTDGVCVSDARLLVQYYRSTEDGRLVFGKGGGSLAFGGQVGAAFDGPSPRAAEVERALRALYPGLTAPVATSWSIASLQRIAGALGVTVADLFEPNGPLRPRVLRREERPALAFGILGHKFLLTPKPLNHLEVFAGELDPGGSTGDEPYAHGDSEELFIVISGVVHLQLGSELYQMGPGDSIDYRSSTPHRASNVGEERAEVLWIISPPSY